MRFRSDGRIIELARSPIGLAVIMITIVVLVGLVVLSVTRLNTGSREIVKEYDAVAEEEVYYAPPTNGTNSEEIVRYVGTFELLMKNGVTPAQYVEFKNAMVGYAEANGIDLKRVSYVDGSFKKEIECLYEFGVVLNENGALLNVKIDATTDCGGTTGLKIMIDKG